ncbi:unnamed protein product [Wickerhamomyces anomalus]
MSNNSRGQRMSISRSRSQTSTKKNSIPENLGPLYDDNGPEGGSSEFLASLNAPYHAKMSSESVDKIGRSSSPSRGLFETHQLNPESIPGNLHVSSNKSIEHLIKRYGAVTLIRQLSTDLAQREAEMSLIRKRNSTRENTLMKLLNEMGLSTSQIELILRERLDKSEMSLKDINDNSYLKDLINDAMSEHFDDVLQPVDSRTSIATSPATLKTPQRSSTSVTLNTGKTKFNTKSFNKTSFNVFASITFK